MAMEIPHLYMDFLLEKVDFHCHVNLAEGSGFN